MQMVSAKLPIATLVYKEIQTKPELLFNKNVLFASVAIAFYH